MQQTVLAREQRHERTEGGGLDDRTQVALADLRHGRVGDAVDRGAGGLGLRADLGTDVDGAVVLDRDLGAGVLLDLVDHLALRADDLTDLVHGDLDGDDPRGVRGHLVRRVDRFHHHVEDVEAGVTGLLEGRGQDGGRDAVQLGVELEGGDELLGAG